MFRHRSFVDVAETLCGLIEKMTGIEPEMDYTLDEVGLASVGIPVIVGMLNSAFSTKKNPISLTSPDLVEAKTIADIGKLLFHFSVNALHPSLVYIGLHSPLCFGFVPLQLLW